MSVTWNPDNKDKRFARLAHIELGHPFELSQSERVVDPLDALSEASEGKLVDSAGNLFADPIDTAISIISKASECYVERVSYLEAQVELLRRNWQRELRRADVGWTAAAMCCSLFLIACILLVIWK